ncbi:O-succinylhomoserine sulfhydrylase [Tistlia consotensis]|uniref:O-succinylhomoserine sulfhydrylase n=1 Tax=Tistlia consotensis USBA 355 TaxID=560819 RepID=A0A1Y6BL88_9PROT|nr:O-succinylhomoserine sulfhydrylase [Tistlia consotensis]SMF13616.1 O-succinylhomoserine sulfhydrylase [Tistlia consotensis USBA 355]SNR50335.1 O-succinylhomoserine sulfhydrylase [Tistlia consotensis]
MSETSSRHPGRPAGPGRATRLVRGGLERSPHGETSEALYLTSGFVYETAASAEARFKGEEEGYVYSRYGNPTVTMFEERIAGLEGAEACFATASGMAAVFSALACQLSAGDRLVASRALFGSCFQVVTQILPRFGVETVLVDGTDLEAWKRELAKGAKVVFFETISNPTLEVLDLPAIVALAKAAGATVVADNVFSTPLLLRPIEHGADVSVYSGTKHIDGQGRCLGGAILCSRKFHDDRLLPFVRHTGPALSPFNAWTLLKGLETLELRVERQARTAQAVAEWLEAHPAVTRVVYPGLASHPQHALAARLLEGFGTVVTFEVQGGKEAAFRLLDSLEIVDISNNLGDAKSLITHPATTTHRSMPEEQRRATGITPGLVRLSPGLESAEDLLADLEQGLAAAGGGRAAAE